MILRPGILVPFTSRIEGGVRYYRTTLENSPSVKRWETERVIARPEDYNQAVRVRAKCQSLIRSACNRTAFGLMCRLDNEEELDAKVAEAHAQAQAFNELDLTCRISLSVLKCYIQSDDEQAARSVSRELSALMVKMEQAIFQGDPKAIREAANKAKALSNMLKGPAQVTATAALKEARGIARKIVKRVEKGAEKIEAVLREVRLEQLQTARFAFLDFAEKGVPEPPPSTVPVVVETMPEPVPEVQADLLNRFRDLWR